MNLIQFLRILVARRWMIILSTLACVLVASAVAFTLPKRYPASARVILDIVKPDPVTGLMPGGRDPRTYIRTQVELIKDLRVAGLVVDRLGLANDPATIARYEATGRTEADGGIRAWLGQQIIDGTSAGIVSGSNILEIRYQSGNPDRAKEIVGALRDAYVDSSLRFRVDAAGRTSDWYREQAEKARQALAASEAEMSKFMVANNLVVQDGVDGETARLQYLRAAVQQARGTEAANAVGASVRLANDPVVDQLQIQIATLRDQLALVGTKLGPQHPDYRALEARIATLQRQVGMAQSNTARGVASVTGASSASLARLEAELAAQEKLVLARKPVFDELVRLSREVELKRGQYERAAARTADLRLEADISETGLVVLGDPQVSRSASYPNIPVIIGMAAAFGLGLGLLAAIVTEFIARRVRGTEDLSYAAGAPVLAVVGAAPPSPLRVRLQKLLGRRQSDEPGGELQAI
jgi:uncharacterized protein involved in exopolysaccharide biosynthesis